MKKIQSKSLLTLIIILIIIGISTTSATRYIGTQSKVVTDSTIKTDSSGNPKGLSMIDNPNRVVYPEILSEHREESKAYIRKYMRKEREYIKLMFRRGKSYLPVARNILNKYDVPIEFQVLPALESNFSAQAVSPAGAVGYWQFMPELAREYGLKIGGKYDERKNFSKSTVAAAKFFRDQLKVYNDDPLLVVAAYNSGTGRVNLAIKKSGIKNPDYWQIREYLPAETRRFVMNFLALNVIHSNYDKFLAKTINFDEPASIQLASYDSVKSEVADSKPSF